MEKTHRLKLSGWQTFNHYMSVHLCLLIFIIGSGFGVVKLFSLNTSSTRSAGELMEVTLPFLFIAIALAIIQYRRLKFREITVSYTEEQFQEAVARTASELEWRIARNNTTLLRAYRPGGWSGSWGEMITIKKRKGRLFVNSICSPDAKASIASYGWNRKNVQVFLRNLKDVLNNKPATIVAPKVEREWSVKNIVVRILLYPLCISLILLGCYALIHPVDNAQGIFAMLVAMTLACVYLYSDIKILTTKKRE